MKFVKNEDGLKTAVENMSISDKKGDVEDDNLSQISTAPNTPIMTNGPDFASNADVAEIKELTKEQICPYLFKHYNVTIDLSQFHWIIFRYAHLELICIDSMCNI